MARQPSHSVSPPSDPLPGRAGAVLTSSGRGSKSCSQRPKTSHLRKGVNSRTSSSVINGPTAHPQHHRQSRNNRRHAAQLNASTESHPDSDPTRPLDAIVGFAGASWKPTVKSSVHTHRSSATLCRSRYAACRQAEEQ